jgi:uncharacterized protein YndB with AHSA1/START domain
MTDHPFTPSPPQPVVAERDGNRWTLVFVRELPNPPEKVWSALTDPEQLREWAPFRADRDLGTVGDATLTMIDGDHEERTASTVELADPPRVLQYLWAGDVVRWELEATGSGTRLTLRHTVESEEWLPRVAAGWHLCLDVADRIMSGLPAPSVVGAEASNHGGNELRIAYAEQLGIPDPGWPDTINAR